MNSDRTRIIIKGNYCKYKSKLCDVIHNYCLSQINCNNNSIPFL